MHTLDGGRIGIAAQALGIAEGALDRAIAYTKERKQFGRSIAQQQNTQLQSCNGKTYSESIFGRSCKSEIIRSRDCNGCYN